MDFYKNIAKYYEYIFPLNKQQVKFILEKIPQNDGKTAIVDLGCAVGTLLVELDKYYNNILGIDLDEDMIQLAKKRDYINSPEIVADNMLNFPAYIKNKPINGIVCFGNTLVHLPNETSIMQLFKTCYNSLDSEGKLLLQIINYDRILDQNITGLSTIENEEVKFNRDYLIDNELGIVTFETTLNIKKTDIEIKNSQSLLPMRKSRLIELLKSVGFNRIESYGNFKGEPFQNDAVPLIIEATK